MANKSIPKGTDSWNYRVCRRVSHKGKTVTYAVYLCRYKGGVLVDWVKNVSFGLGLTFDDLAVDLARINEALVLPVLDFATGAELEPARTAAEVSDILQRATLVSDPSIPQ